jgi:ER-bound oxygenase mpaB/B'/Rubber oxygenase, catalytic domain
LLATGQLASHATTSKRAADTGVILTEVVLHHPSNERAIDGIARMNYLHARYRKSGKILNHDMLYTLSLFALEPIRWTSLFEWRELTNLERCAIGTYWRNMGDSMEISFSALASYNKGWKDGLHFLDDLEEWSKAYEIKHMLPAESNKELAKGTLAIALFNVPLALRGIAMQFVIALLEPRLRKAMQ